MQLLITIKGINIITDPVLNNKTGPLIFEVKDMLVGQ